MPSSNIIYLVNDIIRSRKNTQSVGREYFSWFLRDSAVPLEYIGNLELYRAGAKFDGPKRAHVLQTKVLNDMNESSFHRSLSKRMSSTPNRLGQKKNYKYLPMMMKCSMKL